MKYIHYGHSSFDKAQFVPIQNRECWNKPAGGLWASPVDSEYGWKAWCEEENFGECNDENSFTFAIKPEANIYYIRDVEAANNLPRADSGHILGDVMTETAFSMIMGIDFEAMVKDGVDAIIYEQSACHQLYWKLYGWDCDCVLVMNPDVVVPE